MDKRLYEKPLCKVLRLKHSMICNSYDAKTESGKIDVQYQKKSGIRGDGIWGE